MRDVSAAIAAVALISFSIAAPLAATAQTPVSVTPAPPGSATARYASHCMLTGLASQIDARQSVVDLPAGKSVQEPQHAGTTCVSVLTGTAIVRPSLGRPVKIASGASLLLAPNDRYSLANAGKSAASVVLTDFAPHVASHSGAAAPASPEPLRTIARTMTLAVDAPGQTYQLFQRVTKLPPGGTTTITADGVAVNSVIAGQITLNKAGTVAQIRSGEAWSDRSGEQLSLANNGAQPAQIFTSILVPVGAPPPSR